MATDEREYRRSVRAAFELLDLNDTGTISRAEMIRALRKPQNELVRSLLHLPAAIHQEDGTRTSFERVFQSIDVDEDKSISREEFELFCLTHWKPEMTSGFAGEDPAALPPPPPGSADDGPPPPLGAFDDGPPMLPPADGGDASALARAPPSPATALEAAPTSALSIAVVPIAANARRPTAAASTAAAPAAAAAAPPRAGTVTTLAHDEAQQLPVSFEGAAGILRAPSGALIVVASDAHRVCRLDPTGAVEVRRARECRARVRSRSDRPRAHPPNVLDQREPAPTPRPRINRSRALASLHALSVAILLSRSRARITRSRALASLHARSVAPRA